jgi:hypothetical protein
MLDSDPDPAAGRRPSRRGFVLATGAVLAAAGGGAAAALAKHRPSETPTAPVSPSVLLDAVAAESRLIAAIDAAHDATALSHLRADHVAHREALRGAVQLALGAANVPATAPSTGSSSPASPRLSLTQLRALETAAASAAAAAAAQLTGANAALLASIAACEASHAELLR